MVFFGNALIYLKAKKLLETKLSLVFNLNSFLKITNS